MSMNNEQQTVAEVGADEYGDMTIRAIVPLPIGAKLYLAPVAAAPVEMSPEFTDAARAAISWVLWHHQGSSSPIGQPLRLALGMGLHEPMPEWRIAEAKRHAELAGATTADFHNGRASTPAAPVDLHAHLLHMLGAKDHEDAGRIIGELHAASMSTPAAPGIDLEQFREVVEGRYSLMLNAYEAGHHSYNVMEWHEAERDRLLALIDASPKGGSDANMVPYQRALDLIGDAYNAGTHGVGYSQQAMELHDAMQATSAEVGA